MKVIESVRRASHGAGGLRGGVGDGALAGGEDSDLGRQRAKRPPVHECRQPAVFPSAQETKP